MSKIKLVNPKASFNNFYSDYSPKKYVEVLVKNTNYRIPFDAAYLLYRYLSDVNLTRNYKTVVLGSGYGLDIAALKFGYTYQDILIHWLKNDPEQHKFVDGDPSFKVIMVDINEAPLKFAHKVGLCNDYFVCDLKSRWHEELNSIMRNNTELLICVGATSYIGLNCFKDLVKLVQKSNIEFFCFSLCSFIAAPYLDIFKESNLVLQKLGNVRQRDYKDQEEKNGIINILKNQNMYLPHDDQGLIASVYVASKNQFSY